ncbi:MAG: DUF2306 domain-containing protein [Pseudomonadota bacterium]
MGGGATAGRRGRAASALGAAGALALALLVWPFVAYSAGFGWRGLWGEARETAFFLAGGAAGNAAVFAHMAAGAALTLLAPLQLIGALRRRAPGWHRWVGRTVVALAAATALGGLLYIALRGTVGGAAMSLAFAVYGALMLLSAGQALRFARAGDVARHRRWALRLLLLALGSWLYRVHYGVWELSFGMLGRAPDFSGAFDRANLWAFFVPYLLALELRFAWERRRRAAR